VREVPFAKGKQAQPIDLTRAERFVADLQVELAEVARCHQVMAAIIGDMAGAFMCGS
jgi:hypothetical protein